VAQSSNTICTVHGTAPTSRKLTSVDKTSSTASSTSSLGSVDSTYSSVDSMIGPSRYSQGRSCDVGSGNGMTESVADWMQAIRTPIQYRVGSSTVHFNTVKMAKLGIIMLLVLTVFVLFMPIIPGPRYKHLEDPRTPLHPPYNNTYPLTTPTHTSEGITYRIAIIADPDENSKIADNKWASYMKRGNFFISKDHKKVSVTWDTEVITIKSGYSVGGRGMELSELVVFNGRLYSVDDRTGIVFEISSDFHAYPWVVLANGNGAAEKPFKGEWATVKDKSLYVGGLGKEWTTVTGEVLNLDPQWVKSIGHGGDVVHHDWHEHYDALRKEGGFLSPGYIIHESGVWSDVHKKWFFLPRRASPEQYDEVADERRATNLLFSASEDFHLVQVQRMGPYHPTHGFSSFKFVPGTKDSIIIALKSEEDAGTVKSYITVLSIEGDVLLEEAQIGDMKYEGVEFV